MSDDAPAGGEATAQGNLEALATRAITLAEAATEVQARIQDQQARSRRTVRMLAASVAFDVLLSAGLTILAVQQIQASDAIHQSQLAACAIGNHFRAAQAQVWEHVLDLSSPPPGETPEQRSVRLARLAAFRVYLAKQFRPVDCAALYGK